MGEGGCQKAFQVSGYRLQVTGYKEKYQLPVTSYRLRVAGVQCLITRPCIVTLSLSKGCLAFVIMFLFGNCPRATGRLLGRRGWGRAVARKRFRFQVSGYRLQVTGYKEKYQLPVTSYRLR